MGIWLPASLSHLSAVNFGTIVAAILIASPVLGLKLFAFLSDTERSEAYPFHLDH